MSKRTWDSFHRRSDVLRAVVDQANERRKAVRVAAGAGMLEEEEDPVAAAERVEGQRSGLPSVAVDPADIAQRRGRLAGDPYLHRAMSSPAIIGDGSKAQAVASARRGSTQPGRTKWQV